MLKQYEIEGLDSDDLSNREQLTITLPFTVVLEAEFMELDSLNKWIELNFENDSFEWIFYGKTGYDYGFAEYFTSSKLDIKKLKNTIPKIFTIYPDSYPPNQISKTNGYDEQIKYSEENHDAVIVNIKKEKNNSC